jgi:uracil-DNA glycosylase
MSLNLMDLLPEQWRTELRPHLEDEKVAALAEFVGSEYAAHDVFPPVEDLFTAFRLCPPQQARVLILGQDPYHKAGQAHGLSFSVRPGVAVPPSLRNIFKELQADLGVAKPANGDLSAWASEGVLLLNAVMTVRAATPASHANKGWEYFTDAAIKALNAKGERVVFVLWGSYARKKAALVTAPHHVVIEGGHPSPMNPTGFLGTRPFSAVNDALVQAGQAPLTWGAV